MGNCQEKHPRAPELQSDPQLIFTNIVTIQKHFRGFLTRKHHPLEGRKAKAK